ncbi:MAG TPA: tubulin-like doman-containing protein [Paludibacter sp.]|nr:tubulin-like doman-containing protein [Paludibacter sp.]
MTFPKTLIIGLGGLGSDIVTNVYKRFNSHASHQDDKEKVKFLTLDTDSNEIAERRQIMNPDNVIQTSATTDMVAGQYLDEIKDISTAESWFPHEIKELKKMSINDGAGQIRVVSRLAFAHAINERKLDRLKNVLNELLSLNTGDGNIIEVHIVSSLAGGTGAGSFIQTAYFIREEMIRNGIYNPKIWGYFMLGDIFLKDPSINMSDPTKTTNVLANTYASLKELVGIYEIGDDNEIEFEYGEFTRTPFKITSNSSTPLQQCFLYDFENNAGNNIGGIENYKKQIEDFLYLNAFSPTGPKTRSQAINNIVDQIKTGTAARFGATGISKIIYPVDNLLRYFSVRRLSENLRDTWLKIDDGFNKLHEEWRIDTNRGIIREEPVLAKYFVGQVESLAQNSSGTEQAVFRYILNSTKVIDYDAKKIIGNKVDFFLEAVNSYLKNIRDNDRDINTLSKLFFTDTFATKDSDESNDKSVIRKNEDQLEVLRKEVFSFINENKSLALEEIFVKDLGSYQFTHEQAKHRINTYLLEKDRALHPLAVRYFFYELLMKLELNLAAFKDNNVKRLARISKYDEIYDISDESDVEDRHIETALEAYNIYQGDDKKMLNRFLNITGKPRKLVEFKEEYVVKAKGQANVLTEYALEKLAELVFEDLIMQVKKMIDNLEALFKSIPGVLIGLKNEEIALTTLTSGSSNPSEIYVLAESKHRDYIYNEIIAKKDTIFFPEDISRDIYEELYERTCLQLQSSSFYTINNTISDKASEIFTKLVVTKQKEQLKDSFNDDFAGYNVIQAMKKQAELDGVNAIDFMSEKCRKAETKATPFGAKYDSQAAKINSWAFHPECVEYQNLTKEDADKLFNNPGVAQDNAGRVIADYFDKTEIIREESVMVLAIPDDFPKFAPISDEDKYSLSYEGIYYTHYKKRMKEVQMNNNIPTPHLDKRWNNPKLFRDLGVDLNSYEKNILRAFVYGVVHSDILLINNYGTDTWGFNTQFGIDFFKGSDGKTLKTDIYKLITDALWHNEKMVNAYVQQFDARIKESKEVWNEIRVETQSILNVPLLRVISSFKFENIERFKDKNILTVFNGNVSDVSNDSKLFLLVLDIIIEAITEIAGNRGEDTKKQAKSLLNKMIDSAPEEGAPLNKSNFVKFMENKLRQHFDNV